jgi:hypothetical protein
MSRRTTVRVAAGAPPSRPVIPIRERSRRSLLMALPRGRLRMPPPASLPAASTPITSHFPEDQAIRRRRCPRIRTPSSRRCPRLRPGVSSRRRPRVRSRCTGRNAEDVMAGGPATTLTRIPATVKRGTRIPGAGARSRGRRSPPARTTSRRRATRVSSPRIRRTPVRSSRRWAIPSRRLPRSRTVRHRHRRPGGPHPRTGRTDARRGAVRVSIRKAAPGSSTSRGNCRRGCRAPAPSGPPGPSRT